MACVDGEWHQEPIGVGYETLYAVGRSAVSEPVGGLSGARVSADCLRERRGRTRSAKKGQPESGTANGIWTAGMLSVVFLGVAALMLPFGLAVSWDRLYRKRRWSSHEAT